MWAFSPNQLFLMKLYQSNNKHQKLNEMLTKKKQKIYFYPKKFFYIVPSYAQVTKLG